MNGTKKLTESRTVWAAMAAAATGVGALFQAMASEPMDFAAAGVAVGTIVSALAAIRYRKQATERIE